MPDLQNISETSCLLCHFSEWQKDGMNFCEWLIVADVLQVHQHLTSAPEDTGTLQPENSFPVL